MCTRASEAAAGSRTVAPIPGKSTRFQYILRHTPPGEGHPPDDSLSPVEELRGSTLSGARTPVSCACFYHRSSFQRDGWCCPGNIPSLISREGEDSHGVTGSARREAEALPAVSVDCWPVRLCHRCREPFLAFPALDHSLLGLGR